MPLDSDRVAAFHTAQNFILQGRANLGYQNYLTQARNYNFQSQISSVYTPTPYAILGHNTFHSFPVRGTVNYGGTNYGFNYGTGYVMESPSPHLFIAPRPRYQAFYPHIIVPLGVS